MWSTCSHLTTSDHTRSQRRDMPKPSLEATNYPRNHSRKNPNLNSRLGSCGNHLDHLTTADHKAAYCLLWLHFKVVVS